MSQGPARSSTLTLAAAALATLALSGAASADPAPPAASRAQAESASPSLESESPAASTKASVAGGVALRLDPGLFGDDPALLWSSARANVGSIGPLGPVSLHARPSLWGGGSNGLRAGGAVVMGLGILALFGSGVAGIVAATSTVGLDDDCPNKTCIEGSSGARSLERARASALASDWLLGIGAPVTASGVVMMIYSAVTDRYGRVTSPTPVFFAGPNGGALRFQF